MERASSPDEPAGTPRTAMPPASTTTTSSWRQAWGPLAGGQLARMAMGSRSLSWCNRRSVQLPKRLMRTVSMPLADCWLMVKGCHCQREMPGMSR